MSDRLDHLVALVLDDALEPGDAVELDALLDDPRNHARALALLRIEAALIGQMLPSAGAVQAVIAHCRARNTNRMVAAVMQDIRPRRRTPSSRPGSRVAGIAAALVFVLVGVIGVAVLRRSPAAGDDVAVMTVTSVSGEVRAVVRSASGLVSRGDGIRADSTLRIPAGSTLSMVATDGTGADLSGPAQVTIGGGSGRGPHFSLDSGGITVAAAHQDGPVPMVTTAHADCLVVGTRFTVSIRDGTTTLDVAEGRVRMRAKADGAERLVAGGERCAATVAGMVTGRADPRQSQQAGPRVSGFALAEAVGATVIRPLRDGEAIPAADFRARQMTVIALIGSAPVGSVQMWLNRPQGQPQMTAHWERFAPYTLLGDDIPAKAGDPARCKPWEPQPGTYRIQATAASGEEGRGAQGPPSIITVIITAGR